MKCLKSGGVKKLTSWSATFLYGRVATGIFKTLDHKQLYGDFLDLAG